MNCGAVILAGGKSRRMGRDKAQLSLSGMSFLERLARELRGFSELLISVDRLEHHTAAVEFGVVVEDLWPDCGPLGGLYAALDACKSDALVAVPCDVPLFTGELAEALYRCLKEGGAETDAVIVRTNDGRIHPLCGVYRKRCRSMLRQCLDEKELRMQHALSRMQIKEFAADVQSWRFKNVNTPEDFASLTNRSCLAISGWKNSGKTTLIERLIPLLSKKGLNVAVIKHDGHTYQADVQGTDSERFFRAGACASIVYDREKYSLTRRARVTSQTLQQLAPEADLIILEGEKESDYPKLETVRRVNGKQPIEALKGRLAYVSDYELATELPVFGFAEVQKIADFIMDAYEQGWLRERWKG